MWQLYLSISRVLPLSIVVVLYLGGDRPVRPAQRLIHLSAHYRPVCSGTENTVPQIALRGKHGSSFTVKAAATVSKCSLWFLPGHEVCLGPSIMIATSSAERYCSLLAPGNNSKRGCVLNGCGNACQIKLQTQASLGQKKTDGEGVRQNDVTIKSIHLCAITFFKEKYITKTVDTLCSNTVSEKKIIMTTTVWKSSYIHIK